MSNEAGSKPRNDERTFLYVAIVIPLLIGAGFAIFLLHLNHRERAESFVDASGQPLLIAPDHPRQLIDFSLTDRTGRTVTRSQLNGKILVVDFLFTSCSVTCPVVNRCLSQIQQLTANRPDVLLLSLTVDPRDDTAPVLAKFGERFGAETNRWLLLTGDKDVLYNLIGTSFLNQDNNDPFNYMPGNFSHTDRIALVDAYGHLHGFYDGLNENTASAVAGEISRMGH